MITISGNLYNSFNEKLSFTEVFLQALSSTGDLMASSSTSFRTDGQGYYNKSLSQGTYRLFIRSKDSRQYYLIKDRFVVDENTTSTVINELLI